MTDLVDSIAKLIGSIAALILAIASLKKTFTKDD